MQATDFADLDFRSLGDGRHRVAYALSHGQGLDLYAEQGAAVTSLRQAAGASADPKVKTARVLPVPDKRLAKARSFEQVCHAFGSGDIVYDPTGLVARSRTVVEVVAALRQHLGDRLKLALFDPEIRALSIYVPRPADFSGEAATVRLLDIRKAVVAVLDQFGATFVKRLHVSYMPPKRVAVPIDNRSLRSLVWSQRASKLRKLAASTLITGSALSSASKALAQQNTDQTQFELRGLKTRSDYTPRSTTGNLGAFGAVMDTEAGGFGEGKLTHHFGNGYGIQGNGFVGGFDQESYYNLESHLFYRKTGESGYLIGAVGRYDQRERSIRFHLGAEAEFYPTESVTLFGEAGFENFRRDNRANENNPYALGGIGIYPNKDLGLFGTVGYVNDDFYGAIGTEFQPARDKLPGLAFFADGGASDSEGFARGGLRLYFGRGLTSRSLDGGGDTPSLREQHTRLGIRPHFIPFDSTGPRSMGDTTLPISEYGDEGSVTLESGVGFEDVDFGDELTSPTSEYGDVN